MRSGSHSVEKQAKQPERPKEKAKKPASLKIGDEVLVRSMNLTGTVATLPDSKNKLYVQMGILRSQVDVSDLEITETAVKESSSDKYGPKNNTARSSDFMKSAYISPEINLIAKNVDEACFALDKYLDDALLSHLEQVRIIHGRGTGALQKGIHQYLRKQKFIKSFKLADFDDGGDAITIVKFKK